MKQEDLTKKAIEILNKTKPTGIYSYTVHRVNDVSLKGIKISIRSNKLKWGILTFVIDDLMYDPGWTWGEDDAKCGADKAKTPEDKIIIRIAYIIWRNFLYNKINWNNLN